MHNRLEHLYDCKCDDCNHKSETLTLSLKSDFKDLLKVVEAAFKKLHTNEAYNVRDLIKIKEYRDVIRQTNGILSGALEDNALSDKLLKGLKEDIFYFSQLRTHAELTEASRMLLTSDGKIKSFDSFSNDTKKLKDSYNRNYLEAEYDFAVGSVLMADRFDNFKDGDRYLLQYRTAQDERVRETHQTLHDITLPKEDPFWDKYFPPNGWRCRCTTVQVLSRKNEVSDSKAAIKSGEAATYQESKSGTNKLDIFRFNAGKEKVVFPPKHPYRKVAGANKIKRQFKEAGKAEVKETMKNNRQAYQGSVKTKRFGNVLINRKTFEKTQNINQGSYERQVSALNEIGNVKKHLNAFKGKIKLIETRKEKAEKKPNLLGYIDVPTKDKQFLIGLVKDTALAEDYKVYYIKKVADTLGQD